MNYFDFIFVVLLFFYGLTGFRRGFIRGFLDILVLSFSIILAVAFYAPIGFFISQNIYPLPLIVSNSIAFFIVWFVVEFIYFVLSIIFYNRIPEDYRLNVWNKGFGVLTGVISGVLLIWFGLVFVLTVPVVGFTKDLKASFFVKKVSPAVDYLSIKIANVFGEDAKQAIKFITLKPAGNEKIDLGFKVPDAQVDEASEIEMLKLVNQARTEAGLKELVLDTNLRSLARDYGRTLFSEGYFSHNGLDGSTPFERMQRAEILYLVAGENLAIAENVTEASKGLMASPTHRDNILAKDFGKIGIGVVDGGKYGKIFVQEFTN